MMVARIAFFVAWVAVGFALGTIAYAAEHCATGEKPVVMESTGELHCLAAVKLPMPTKHCNAPDERFVFSSSGRLCVRLEHLRKPR